MCEVRLLVLALAGMSVVAVPAIRAGTFSEDFSTEPAARGWKIFGDTNLFSWNGTDQNLQVTWDSSHTNSYFYRPLGTTLDRNDDFSLECDLRLSAIATNAKSGPFEIAVGFLNLADATSTNFWRGTGVDAAHGPRNLVEFDYFPAGYYSGFGDVAPSISPTVVSADNVFAAGFDLLEMTTNDLFRISLSYIASNGTLHTSITRNGLTFDPVDDVSLGTNFTDFRIDTVSISSYSDVGDDFDSVLARGKVDNLTITFPSPPVANVFGGFTNGAWNVQFISRSNWVYTLERTRDFKSWTPASLTLAGNATSLVLTDTNSPGIAAFYRVYAKKP